MKLAHVMSILSIIAAILVSMTFGYVFYLLIWDFKVVTLKEFTVPPEVVQGEPIPYTLSFDKHLNYKPTTRYYVTHEHRQPLEVVTSSVNRETKEQTVRLSLALPSTLEADCGYRLQVNLAYQIIPSRTIPYTWTSNQFCIIINP